MKILVLNGSPKNRTEYSFSSVYIDHIRAIYPAHEFETVFIARDVDELLSRREKFDAFSTALRECDGFIWQVPVFTALIPSQVKQFIEFVFADAAIRGLFAGKYCTAITTSIQIFDNWAEYYLQSVSEQMGAICTETISGQIQPVIGDDFRIALKGHLNRFFEAIECGYRIPRRFTPVKNDVAPISLPAVSQQRRSGHPGGRIGVIADTSDDRGNLKQMLDYFCAVSPLQVDVLDLSSLHIRGCASCMNCLKTQKCVLKDGFQEAHERYVMSADAVVYAGVVREDYFSARIKHFMDREFYLQHRQIYTSKPMGLIISGPFYRLPLFQESIASIWSARGGKLNAPVCDDHCSSQEIAAQLDWLAQTIVQKVSQAVPEPLGYYAAAANRTFRDFSWLTRFPFVAEYKSFKQDGRYASFPYKLKRIRYRIFKLQMLMFFRGFHKALKKYNEVRMKGMRRQLPS